MKPEWQKIKIAEAMGFKYFQSKGSGTYKMDTEPRHPDWVEVDNIPDGYEGRGNYVSRDTPSYPSDLNACHTMEGVLTKDQHGIFMNALVQVLERDKLASLNKSPCDIAYVEYEWTNWMMLHATAAQRCEAFLKTLSLWEDGE